KARVIIGNERREEGIAFRQGRRTGQPQFLDQAILQRLVGTFDPTLGRARIGADDVDVERVQGVRDNGTGIAPEVQNNCFSPLLQQSRPAKAPASACRSPMTSSPSNTAARSRSTAGSASSPNLRSACRVPNKLCLARMGSPYE